MCALDPEKQSEEPRAGKVQSLLSRSELVDTVAHLRELVDKRWISDPDYAG